MSGPLRRLAGLVGGLLEHVYPTSKSGWARGMRCEIDQVEADGAALMFALGCLWGGCRQAAAERLSSSRKGVEMTIMRLGKLPEPRTIGIACAFAATCLGLFYLAAAGAPARYLVVNSAAFLLGIAALGGVASGARQLERFAGVIIFLLGSCLLATALFGATADGASRWIRFGPVGVQVSLVLLPFLIVAFARHRDALGTVGVAVAAIALALQPDRAMAGVLAFATAALALAARDRFSVGALLFAVAAFIASLLRPDALPAVPYVDRVLFTAFDVHLLTGAAVVIGSLLLLVPAVTVRDHDADGRQVRLAFGAVWLGCVAAAALGDYPTPVVGYGGSAILGYLLSLSALGRATAATADIAPRPVPHEGDELPRLQKAALPA